MPPSTQMPNGQQQLQPPQAPRVPAGVEVQTFAVARESLTLRRSRTTVNQMMKKPTQHDRVRFPPRIAEAAFPDNQASEMKLRFNRFGQAVEKRSATVFDLNWDSDLKSAEFPNGRPRFIYRCLVEDSDYVKEHREWVGVALHNDGGRGGLEEDFDHEGLARVGSLCWYYALREAVEDYEERERQAAYDQAFLGGTPRPKFAGEVGNKAAIHSHIVKKAAESDIPYIEGDDDGAVQEAIAAASGKGK